MPFEYASNPFVGLRLIDPARIQVEPAAQVGRFGKSMRSNNGWFGIHILIAPRNFGFDLPPLVAALVRYVGDPQAREELVSGHGRSVTVASMRSSASPSLQPNLPGRTDTRCPPR